MRNKVSLALIVFVIGISAEQCYAKQLTRTKRANAGHTVGTVERNRFRLLQEKLQPADLSSDLIAGSVSGATAATRAGGGKR